MWEMQTRTLCLHIPHPLRARIMGCSMVMVGAACPCPGHSDVMVEAGVQPGLALKLEETDAKQLHSLFS